MTVVRAQEVENSRLVQWTIYMQTGDIPTVAYRRTQCQEYIETWPLPPIQEQIEIAMHIQALSVVTLASGLVAWAIYSFLDKRRHVMKAKAKGCKPPVQAMSREPTGIANLFRGLMASRQMSFLDFLLECMNDLSQRIGRPAGTVVVRNALFRDAIITYDPENIQAILARQFQDFGLGVNRTDNLKPLLGNGIVGLDRRMHQPRERVTYHRPC